MNKIDSGVEWLGKIPDSWKIVPNKVIMHKEKNICEKYNNENILSLTMNGVIVRDLENPSGKMPATFDGYQIVKSGNLLMCLFDIDVTPRCIGLIENDGLTSPAYSNFVLHNGYFNKYYYYYYLMLDNTKELLHLAKNLRHSLTEEQLGYIPTLVPPFDTQVLISELLDNKISKIDALIANQEEQIVKLIEYKKKEITKVVTKGLYSVATMKNTNVKWIGQIPEHWNCCYNKYLFQYGNGALRIGPFGSSLSGKMLPNGQYKIYNQAHLVNDDFSLSRHFIDDETFEQLKSYEVLPGDILFSMMGTIGKCKIMPEGYMPGIMDSHLLKARLNELILPEYYLYVFDKDLSDCVISQLKYLSNGSIMSGLNSTIVKNIMIPVPPINEQLEIIQHLNPFCKKMDKLISLKKDKINKLQEYKKSIIYEYVTGKKSVYAE